ncbi:hypothetical protein BB934_45485 (plasmid) [Microvirga ossetica]|uniref:Uncharacterized protein n=1 Tax=Microvirga ossetica TaxID=1882682 RepID=A0A1B2EZQ5_9HYPH|nr:hypothetical protein [Microvirga ossetica]ANY85475.1 hypothetical protein BB934_45485 [Microvirga ossetica]
MIHALKHSAKSRIGILLTGLALYGVALMELGKPMEFGDPASTALAVVVAGIGLWMWEVVHNARREAG